MAVARRSAQPPLAPSKKLIITCDGTWLDSANIRAGELEHPSNVARIGWAVRDEDYDGKAQIVYYQSGVGSQGGLLMRVAGGLTGEGIKENIREAYSFIATNYINGDEIYLLGFSRGAFTARSVGGMIGDLGLLTKAGLPSFGEIFEDYVHRKDSDYRPHYPDKPFPNKPPFKDPDYVRQLEERGLTTLNIPIRAIGVFETVGSLGIPRVPWLERVGLQSSRMKAFQFYDTTINEHVENAFQALCLDEKRAAFSPALWEKHRNNVTNLKQVWFPGVHSNVGGGYPDQEIANITLAWMVSQLEPFIDFDLDTIMKAASNTRQYYRSQGEKPRPWSFGKIYNSITPVYTIAGSTTRTPGDYFRINRRTGKTSPKPLKNTHEYIHPSVRTRTCLDGPGIEDRGDYDSKALKGWSVTVDRENINRKNSTVIWKAPRGQKRANKVLPESILRETEWRMLERCPEMYDYLARDPRGTLGKR
ncbi:MAG: hypothetical protein Q9195_003583 [Heterodermia aff. obscurata]